MPHTTAPTPADTATIHYRVHLHDLHAHLYRVVLTIAQPAAHQEVRLPVWIPGSYLVREFAKNLHQLQAQQNGQPCQVEQRNKNSWRLHCVAGQPLQLEYLVSAYDPSVRMAWLDQRRGFFNGTSLLLRVLGQEAQAHTLDIVAPEQPAQQDWQLATGLTPCAVDARGFGCYQAAHYDELVDAPVEMGHFWSASFDACGVPHRLVVTGAPASFDGARLLADTQKICAAQIRLWHPDGTPPPQRSYVFLLHATHNGYGGLEHHNSTALICARSDLPRQGASTQPEGYTTLLGLISHEYFHTWNVKRLRPAQFEPYDYDQENYTELLWFFEGLTSYYDDLILQRTGLIDSATYLKLLGKTLNQVRQTPGRHVQSVAQASFDAWVKYYRQDENTANATVSYYTKGALVGLCLDLALRQAGSSLDALMRALWQRCAGGALRETDILAALHELTGRSWATDLQAWVHGTHDLPVAELLAPFGVRLEPTDATPAQRLGLRVQEGSSIQVQQVLRGSVAEQAGFMAGDEWYGIEVDGCGWRIASLDDLALHTGQRPQTTALVARDRQLLRLALTLPAPDSVQLVQLRTSDHPQLASWLVQAPASV